jgi:hypothetical protein
MASSARSAGLNINVLNLQDRTLFNNMPANQNGGGFRLASRAA